LNKSVEDITTQSKRASIESSDFQHPSDGSIIVENQIKDNLFTAK
jgi:hypothetical protein